MASNPPDFESVEDKLRGARPGNNWRSSLEEQQSRDGARRAAAKHEQLRRFFVDGGYLKGVLVLVNVQTGQAAAALEVEHGGEVHTLSRSETRLRKWGPYKRIRIGEAQRLLQTGRVELEDVPWHGFQICLADGTYPEWLFTPTDESETDWKPVAADFRRRAALARRLGGHASLPGAAWRLVLAAVFGIAIGATIYIGLRYLLGVELLKALGFGNF